MQDVKIALAGDRVELRAPWSPAMPAQCKSIYGAKWQPEGKAWSYPLDMDTLRRMREVFGERLAVHPDLNAWAREAVAKERTVQRFATMSDADLRFVGTHSPRLAEAMGTRTYQRVGAKFGATVGNFLLADEPGLGKTATALAALMEAEAWKGDVLVIAPKSSITSVWARQIKMWTGAPVIAAPEGRVKREAAWSEFLQIGNADAPRFFVVNPAMVRRKYGTYCIQCKALVKDVENTPEHYLNHHTSKRIVVKDEYPGILDHHWSTVILDESHDLLATVKSVWGDAKNKLSMQVQGLFDIAADRRIALTGTPLRGQEKRVWGTLTWLNPEKFKGYWRFMESYFEIEAGYGDSRNVLGLKASRRDDFYRLVDQYMLRRTRAEVRSDLPNGQIMDVLVEMSAEQRKQYEEFRDQGEAKIRDGLVAGNGVLSELMRLKQLAYGPAQTMDAGRLVPSGDSPKLDWLLQFLDERGVRKADAWLPEDGGYKYVVASQFTEVLDSLETRLNAAGIPTLKITGAVTGAKRDRAIESFQDDTRDRAPRVMLLNTKTGGVAIELDAWCDEMVILDETWIADDQVQLRGRIDNRSGRVAPRTFWYVRTAETIEQTIAERNFAQADMEHELLDGRRGVETALHLLRKDA